MTRSPRARETKEGLAALPFDVRSLRSAYAGGLSPAEVMREVLRRHAAVDDPGIFIHLLTEDRLVAATRALGPCDVDRFPLWGVPFAVKDNIDVQDMPTTAACAAFAYQASDDAPVVAALRAAGAIVVGKTNLDQFATGLVGTRTPWPVPRNAFNPALVPGGSSSGSAVAVAHGIVSFALGTDTAGSGRVPAVLNNIVGLKPTPGRLSARGMVPACRTIDTVSFFALSVHDAMLAMQHAGGHDPLDPFARRFVAAGPGAVAQAANVAIPDAASLEWFEDELAAKAWQEACRLLTHCGARLVPTDLAAFFEIAELLYGGSWIAERHAVVQELLAASPEAFHPVTREIIGAALGKTATDAFRDRYRLEALLHRCEPAMAAVDFMAVPTIPTVCTLERIEREPIAANSRLGRYTNFANLMKLAAIALPLGDRGDGFPHGLTLLARGGQEANLAAFAAKLAGAAQVSPGVTGWQPDTGLASAASPDPADHEQSIVVVGAHLSGMPLNHQLTARGARLLRETKTAARYRLLALAGGPAHRPALVRAGDGAAIAVEVWALPRDRLADFMADIAPPLGLGTVWLADGSTTMGFICEPAALEGATDITHHGGWRAYVAAQPAPGKPYDPANRSPPAR